MKKVTLLSTFAILFTTTFGWANGNPETETDLTVTGLSEYDASFSGSAVVNAWFPTYYIFTARDTASTTVDTLVQPTLLGSTPNVTHNLADALTGVFNPNTTYEAGYRTFTVMPAGDTLWDVTYNLIIFTTLDTPQTATPVSIVQTTGADLQYVPADYSWQGGNINSTHQFQCAIDSGVWTYPTGFTNPVYSNSGTDQLTFGPFPFDEDTIYVRVKTLNPFPFSSSDWYDTILIKPTPVAPMFTDSIVDSSYGLPGEVLTAFSFDLGTSTSAVLDVEFFDDNGSLGVMSATHTTSGTDTIVGSGYAYPGNISGYAVAILTDQLTLLADTVTLNFNSESYVDPLVDTIIVDPLAGGPSEFEVSVTFDLGTSASADYTLTAYDSLGNTVDTYGPAPTLGGVETHMMSGFLAPGGTGGYVVAEIVDPSTLGGDVDTSLGFNSELYEEFSVFVVGIDTSYGALGESQISFFVPDTGDCGPATLTLDMYVNGNVVTSSVTPIVLDSIGQFTDVITGPSGAYCTIVFTVISNCSQVDLAPYTFTNQVIPGLSLVASVNSAGVGNEDKKLIGITGNTGIFSPGLVYTETYDANGQFLSSSNQETVNGQFATVHTVTDLEPSSIQIQYPYTTYVTLTDVSGQNQVSVELTYSSDMVQVASGSGVVIDVTESEIFASAEVTPNGSWMHSATSAWMRWVPDNNNFPTLTSNIETGLLGNSSIPVDLAIYDVNGGIAGTLEFYAENGGGIVMYHSQSVQMDPIWPSETWIFADSVNGGNYAEVTFIIDGNGVGQTWTLTDRIDGASVGLPATGSVGSSRDTIVLVRGPFGNCQTVEFDLQVNDAETNESGYVYLLPNGQLPFVETACPASIKEAFWGETQLATLNPEFIQLPDDVVNATIEVVDVSGRVLSQITATGGRVTFSSTHYPSGMYIVRVLTDQDVAFSKKVMMK